MRLIPILTALLVTGFLYLLVFERDTIGAFAANGPAEEAEAQAAPGEAAPRDRSVGVVVLRSEAQEIDSAVILRGQTEAARQVDVRAETAGQVISEPLRKGAFVEEGQELCRIDPGTREATLAEADARLTEAKSRLPEAEARLTEAQARLEEALINDRAAAKLSQDGFASETRVANARAAVESARAAVSSASAGVSAAQSGIQAAEAGVLSARTELDRLSVTAPFSGLLESDAAELGSLLQPGSLCATIIQLDPVKLVGFVPETEVGRVDVGARAGARLVDGTQLSGRVTFLSRSADPSTRTFRTEITVPNPALAISDGQTAEILIQAQGAEAHLLPQSALTLNDDGVLGVRLASADDTALFAPVTLLRDTTEGVWVAGLDTKADVIVTGQEYVTDGVAIRPTYREAAQ